MKQVFTIQSEVAGEPDQQLLSIRIGERHMGFAVTSLNGQQLFHLCWYAGGEADEPALEDIYQQQSALRASYTKVHVCFDYPRSILVPLPNYKEQDRKPLIESMYGILGKEVYMTETVAGWQLNNVFAVPEQVQQWAGRHFPNYHYWHGYTIGIGSIESTDFEGALVANFRSDDFSLIVSKGNKLLLAQTFAYSTPADVIYYLLKTCQAYSFSQQEVRLALSGLIDRESALYRELLQYFIEVRFRETAWSVPDGVNTSYPAHFFTSLNELAICES